MAYYHKRDNGKIIWLRFPRPWVVRCSKCGKRWPTSVLFQYPPPKDMTRFIVETKKEPATYARWADKIPMVNIVPRFLPNWPRWARLLVTCVLIAVIVGVVILIRGI